MVQGFRGGHSSPSETEVERDNVMFSDYFIAYHMQMII